jgi:hypothetical protein
MAKARKPKKATTRKKARQVKSPRKPKAEATAGLSEKDRQRANRKLMLDALKEETGSSGGTAAAARVEAYRADPLGASLEDFAFVGALILTRFYVDPTKPNDAERASLWTAIMQKMGKPGVAPKTGWDGKSDVKKLQAIAEFAQ